MWQKSHRRWVGIVPPHQGISLNRFWKIIFPPPPPRKKIYKKHVNKNMFHPVKHISCLQESSDSVRVLTDTRCMCQHIDICFSTFSHCFSTLICVDLNDCFKVLSLIPSSQPELGLPYVAVQVDSWVTASLAFVPWQKHWLPHTEEGGDQIVDPFLAMRRSPTV